MKWIKLNRFDLFTFGWTCYNGFYFTLLDLDFRNLKIDSSLFGIGISKDYLSISLFYFDILITYKPNNQQLNLIMENKMELKSMIFINPKGILMEEVDFGYEKIDYEVNGICDHRIFGIFLAFVKPDNNGE